jgi:hypothetical protein
MWGFGTDPSGTLVQTYLESRRVRLPQTDEIRFWRHGRFGQSQVTPLMMAAVRDIKTNDGIAVHRTALDLEGRKAYLDLYGNMDCRAFSGSPKGGAIKLLPLGPRLGVGEGIETTLSLREFNGYKNLPVWSMMSDLGLASLPVLDGVEELIVAEDNDGGGIVAASEVAARWRKAGRRVRVLGPRTMPDHSDLNDMNDVVRRLRNGKKEEARQRGRGLD